jgi:hypothetical protein
MRIAVLTSAIALALLVSRPGVVMAQGIYVYPAEIKFDDVLRGGDYFRTVGVVNNNDSDTNYRFETNGEMAQWLSFVDSEDRTTIVPSLLVPAHSEGRVLARVHVPSDVPNGTYKAGAVVLATVSAGTQSGSGSTVNIGAQIAIEANVTGTQQLAGSLLDMTVTDTEVGLPLDIRSRFQNSGNVVISPQIGVTVLNNKAATIDQKTFADQAIYPNEIKTILSQWDTSNALPGDYVGHVTVNFGGLDLGGRDLPFKIFQRGTLTRQGTLETLKLANRPDPGGLAKIEATVVNTGQIESKMVFVGEFFRGSTLVKAVTSLEGRVARGESGTIEIYLDVPQAGKYTLKGKANFEGKESEVKELTFRVGNEGGISVFTWVLIVAGGAAAVLVLGGGWMVRRKRMAAR